MWILFQRPLSQDSLACGELWRCRDGPSSLIPPQLSSVKLGSLDFPLSLSLEAWAFIHLLAMGLGRAKPSWCFMAEVFPRPGCQEPSSLESAKGSCDSDADDKEKQDNGIKM